MKINKIGIIKLANYTTSFDNKRKEEQNNSKKTIGINQEEEQNCVVEEIDSRSTLINLEYNEKKGPLQGIPKKHKINTRKIQQTRNHTENTGINKNIQKHKTNQKEDEICVIEEIDSKQSLIGLGYQEIKVPLENIPVPKTGNIMDERPAKDCIEIINMNNKFSGQDINDFSSADFIDTILEFNGHQDKAVEGIDGKPPIKQEDGNRKDDDKSEANQSFEEQTENENLNKVLQKEDYYFKKVNDIDILPAGDIHIINKLGFLSLIATLSLLGIFAEYRAYLGFLGFLYYVRYFFVLPDKLFKINVQKAAAFAFFTNLAAAVLTVILGSLVRKAAVFPVGMGMGIIISIVVFTIVLIVYEVRKSGGNQQ